MTKGRQVSQEEFLKFLLDKQNAAYRIVNEEKARAEFKFQSSMRFIRKRLYNRFGIRIGDKIRYKDNLVCRVRDVGVYSPYDNSDEIDIYIIYKVIGKDGKFGTFHLDDIKDINVIK